MPRTGILEPADRARRRITGNLPTLATAVPVLLARGGADTLISPAVLDANAAERWAAGQRIDYGTRVGRGPHGDRDGWIGAPSRALRMDG